MRKWNENSKALAQMFGLDSNDLTIYRLNELSRIAILCFAGDKPEPQWFDEKYLEQVEETISKAKLQYQDYNLLKSRLDETYSDGIYDLELDELIARYSGPYQSGLKIFNSTYRSDQKLIASLANDGKVPKNVLNDLIDVRKVKKLRLQIEESAETVRRLLGHFYDKAKPDFQGAEKAIALTVEIKKFPWATQIPESLLKLITNISSPSPMIKNLGLDLQESVDRWQQLSKDIEQYLPVNLPKSDLSINQTSLSLLEEWANETEKQLTSLIALTNVGNQ